MRIAVQVLSSSPRFTFPAHFYLLTHTVISVFEVYLSQSLSHYICYSPDIVQMTDKSIHELFDDSWYDSDPLRTMRTMESTFLSNISNLNGHLVFIDLIKAGVTLRGLVQHHDEYKSHLLLYHGVHLPRPKPPQMSFTRSRIPLIQPIY
jgi:hypothetical protein